MAAVLWVILALSVLAVANRPGTLALADQVVFLHAGQVAATGSHAQLLTLDEYRRIVTAYDRPREDSDAGAAA